MGLPNAFGILGSINRFSPERFEDLINRRGWKSVLWERATKCSCYSENTGNPDPKDPVCGGTGYVWTEDLRVDVGHEQLTVSQDGQSQFQLLASLVGVQDSTRTIVSDSVRVTNETTRETYTVTAVSGVSVSISGTNLPLVSDIVSASYAYLRDSGATVRAIITNVDYQRDYIPAGEWLQGDAVMTVSGTYKMGYRDRITIPESVVRTAELKRRNEVDVYSRSLERLRYKSGISSVTLRDQYRSFTLGTEFTLGADETIMWVSGGVRPKHASLNITYTGNSATALLTVTSTGIAVVLSGHQTDGSENLSLTFANFPTPDVLVTEICKHTGYVAALEQQGSVSGVDNKEALTSVTPVSSTSIRAVSVVLYCEDKTQYTIEYMHYLAYSIYNRQGMTRRPDSGAVLPSKWWLRLWEHTDSFSNINAS